MHPWHDVSPGPGFPANYGFIPRTLEADGDALDVFVFARGPARRFA